MEARRTEKISAVLTPELAGRLSEFASRHRWSVSTAVAELVEQGTSDSRAGLIAEEAPDGI